jgi:hypothetical protein
MYIHGRPDGYANSFLRRVDHLIDTKKLVVGQIVKIASGPYGRSGKVVLIEPDGIHVDMRNEQRTEIWKFDNNGRACDSRDVGYVPEMWEFDGIPSTYEGGYWELIKAEGW